MDWLKQALLSFEHGILSIESLPCSFQILKITIKYMYSTSVTKPCFITAFLFSLFFSITACDDWANSPADTEFKILPSLIDTNNMLPFPETSKFHLPLFWRDDMPGGNKFQGPLFNETHSYAAYVISPGKYDTVVRVLTFPYPLENLKSVKGKEGTQNGLLEYAIERLAKIKNMGWSKDTVQLTLFTFNQFVGDSINYRYNLLFDLSTLKRLESSIDTVIYDRMHYK
ncbi:hypothetical protein ACQKLP_10700 [Chitinophaga sp. NPDC101104]|uniref:hypothetical protein n=1 Tax=Chitinophaga sp. NPDC101104 TaxID=3390561 RepID=UPI003CFEF764